jgi:exosortase
MEVMEKSVQPEVKRPLIWNIIPFIIMVALVAILYRKAIQWWYFEWTTDGSYYAHAIFIPFFVAAMLWRMRGQLARMKVERNWWGVIPMALALLLIIYSERAEVTVVLSFSFILFLIGASLLMTGKKITKTLLLPMLFLFSVIPIIPNQVIGQAAFPIQMASTKLATTLLHLATFKATRIGTSIVMDSYSLNVEVACSGFKTLIGLMAFSGAFAYLIEAALWKRLFLFLISAPLSVLINGVRITLIGIVGEIFSSETAHSFHDYSGFIVLILGFMLLFSLAQLLGCEKFYGMSLKDNVKPVPKEEAHANELKMWNEKFGQPQHGSFSVLSRNTYPVLILLGLMCLIQLNTHAMQSTYPLLEPADIPAKLGDGWQQVGADVPMTKIVRETLQPDTTLERIYSSNKFPGSQIDFFFTGGNSRHTFHDPHDCFVGSGFMMHDLPVDYIQTSAGTIPVQVSIAEDPVTKSTHLLMFVYIVDGQPKQTMSSVHYITAIHALIGTETRPFYFFRFMQGVRGTGDVRREELTSFIQKVWPNIAPHVIAP